MQVGVQIGRARTRGRTRCILAAASPASPAASARLADDGGAGLLVLALLAAGAGELDADQLNDAQAVFAGALAALEAFRASVSPAGRLAVQWTGSLAAPVL